MGRGATSDTRVGRDGGGAWPLKAATAAVCMAAFGALLLKLGVYRMKAEPPYAALFKIALSACTVAVLMFFSDGSTPTLAHSTV